MLKSALTNNYILSSTGRYRLFLWWFCRFGFIFLVKYDGLSPTPQENPGYYPVAPLLCGDSWQSFNMQAASYDLHSNFNKLRYLFQKTAPEKQCFTLSASCFVSVSGNSHKTVGEGSGKAPCLPGLGSCQDLHRQLLPTQQLHWKERCRKHANQSCIFSDWQTQ